MRVQGLIFAAIATGTVSAQTLSVTDALGLLLSTDAETLIEASSRFDAIDPAAYGILAPVLATWITNVRDLAIESGVEEIPKDIRDVLADFVPDDVLDSVRWGVDGRVFSIGQVQAATFDHVVLFASEDAATDPKTWVHELFHVIQYRDWGVDAFASRYLADRTTVENDAWAYLWEWIETSD